MKSKTIKVQGIKHTVKKNKKGDVVVDHEAKAKAGKWDKINLTKKGGSKTVKEGVKAVKEWHKKNDKPKNNVGIFISCDGIMSVESHKRQVELTCGYEKTLLNTSY